MLSLKCQEYSNFPTDEGASPFNASARTYNCPMYSARCATLSVVMMKIPLVGEKSFVMKNCSSSLACGSGSALNPCKMSGKAMNTTGSLKSCSYVCCEGDMCNAGKANNSTTQPPGDTTTATAGTRDTAAPGNGTTPTAGTRDTAAPGNGSTTATAGARDTAARFGAIFMPFAFSIGILGF